MKKILRHYLNPLHVYCRLRDLGLKAPMALRVSTLYERALYRRLALSGR